MTTTGARRATAATPAEELADRWHSLAIHLLRRLRREDQRSGLTGPRASALSVLVFGGATTLGELAAAEQVRPPTMSRLVRALEREGLVRRERDPDDGRVVRLRATRRGAALLVAARARRVRRLAAPFERLTPLDRELLTRSADVLVGVIRELV